MTFQDMQSMVLYRLRQRGANFGAPPINTPADFDPPNLVALLLNEGYQEFLVKVKDFPVATLQVFLPTTGANTLAGQQYSLAPVPSYPQTIAGLNYVTTAVASPTQLSFAVTPGLGPLPVPIPPGEFVRLDAGTPLQEDALVTAYSGGVLTVALLQNTHQIGAAISTPPYIPNPFALQVYEFTYVQGPVYGAGLERYIPLIGTPRFRRWAGGYTRRYSNYAAFPQVASQMFGQRSLAFVPGIGNNGDTIKLTICPDPQGTDAYYNTQARGMISVPASAGGILSAATDQPLVPAQFHGALVEFAVWKGALAAGKSDIAKDAKAQFDQYVTDAQIFGSSYGEGDSEQVVSDPWATYDDRDITLWA